ncbi:hypothetical protein V6N13_043810 [Hibiscus sabdariffa]
MTISLEALAMSGADYNEWGLDIEKWEDDDASHCPPPHLLPEEDEEEPTRVVKRDTEIFSTGSPTRPSIGFNAGGECRHGRPFRSRSLPKKMIQSSRSMKRMIKYMSIVVLMIAMILDKKRFLKPC